MNKKGFTLIDLMIVIFIIGIIGSLVVPTFFAFIEEEKIAQKAGSFVKEFNEEVDPKVRVETKTVTIDRSGVKCIEGKKAIEIGGKIYYIGDIDTWGDIKGIECQ